MTFAQLLTASAKNFGTGSPRHPAAHDAHGENVRPAPTGDPRLDLAHADRSYR